MTPHCYPSQHISTPSAPVNPNAPSTSHDGFAVQSAVCIDGFFFARHVNQKCNSRVCLLRQPWQGWEQPKGAMKTEQLSTIACSYTCCGLDFARMSHGNDSQDQLAEAKLHELHRARLYIFYLYLCMRPDHPETSPISLLLQWLVQGPHFQHMAVGLEPHLHHLKTAEIQLFLRLTARK